MCLEMLGQVLEISAGGNGTPGVEAPAIVDGTAIVNVDGVARRISLAVLEVEGTRVVPGDWVLCHTGLALRVLDQTDARKLQNERDEMHASLGTTPLLESESPPPEREQLRDDGEL